MDIPSRHNTRYQTITLWRLALVAAATILNLPAQANMPSEEVMESKTIQTSASARTPEMVIRVWPELARSIARVMIEKYGQPDRLSSEALVWYNNGPWQKTIVYRRAWPHSKTMRDGNFLEQTIAYQVPDAKINALTSFDQRISVNKIKGELSCRSDSERTNFLALNLADEIVNDKRSVQDAQDFYQEAQRLSQSGKTSPYMEGFLFELFNDNSTSPEYPVHL